MIIQTRGIVDNKLVLSFLGTNRFGSKVHTGAVSGSGTHSKYNRTQCKYLTHDGNCRFIL